MPAILMRILPAAALLFWAVRIFLRKDVSSTQLLMVAGMLVSVFSAIASDRAVVFVFPLFFLALKMITAKDGIQKWDWLILLPSLVILIFENSTVFYIFLCIQVISLTAWSAVGVHRYNRLAAEYYDTGNDASDVMSQTLIFLTATVVVTAIIFILPDGTLSLKAVSLPLGLFLTVLQYLFGQNVYDLDLQNQIPEESPVSDEDSTEVETAEAVEETMVVNGAEASGTCTATDQDWKLLQRVTEEKMYLDPMISLVSMAEKLNTNRTYLSNSIHACHNQNFSDYINNLRIQYALELMKAEMPDVNIKNIALRSGYNHPQSFYRNFAQIMEMTPKMWLSEQTEP